MINGHGDDLYRFKGQIHHNFSSNVYYKGCSPLLLSFLSKNINAIQNYPSPATEELNVLAAKKHQLNSNQFLFTNGATEAFYLIAHHFKGKTAGIVSPTFSEYEDAAKIHQIDCSFLTATNLTEKAGFYDLVFICNPNNPDGNVYTTEDLKKLITAHPTTFFVIDEAYIEFTNAITSSVALLTNYKNLAIVKSLTKTFVIPGLRLGYVIANVDFIQKLLLLKMPWSVNAMAVEAGKIIFKNYDDLSFKVDVLMQETESFRKELSQIEWLDVHTTHTNYFLVELKRGTATSLKEYLANQHQILIRDATNFKQLDGEFLRLSTQSLATNKLLIKALREWV